MENELIIPVELDTKNFDRQIDMIEDELFRIEEKLKHKKEISLSEKDVTKLEEKAEKLRNKLVDLNRQKEKWNQEEFEPANLSGISNATEGIIKKVIKWGLALFSIRSAYTFIRSAVSTLTQTNEQLATDIEYIRWALATALQPVIEFIIKLVYTLLSIINSITMALFGVNLFANATTKAFQNQNKALKGANKQANELKKTLAGFDEMNIIQDSGDVSSGGGAGGVGMPSADLTQGFDLTALWDILSGWKDAFMSFWDGIIQFWEEEWWNFFSSIKGPFALFFQGLGAIVKGFWEMLQSIGEMIIGLLDMLWGILTLDLDRIKEGFGILIDGLVNLIGGFFLTLTGAFMTVAGLIRGVLETVFTFVYNTVVKPILNVFSTMWNTLVKSASLAWSTIKNIFGPVASFFGTVFGNAWNTVKNIFSTGGQIFVGIVEGIAHAFGRIVNAIIEGINKIIAIPFQKINGVLNWIRNIDIPLIGQPFKGFWKQNPIPIPSIPTIPLETGGIVNMPGRGVPIAGERGQEGIIPLTDSQQMDLLGQAIGKYVSLNATIPVYVGNRQIAREIRTINNESDFAFNR